MQRNNTLRKENRTVSGKTVFSFTLTLLMVLLIAHGSGWGTAATNTDPLTAQAPAMPPPQDQTSGFMPQRGEPGGKTAPAMDATTFKDIAYASVSATQKLDLYVPTVGSGPFPLVVIVHGGAFMFGDKADRGSLIGAKEFLASGYAVAGINYRLSGEARFPAQIWDVKAAIRFLRTHAARYKLNHNKFGVFGASAGGHLVSLLGTSAGVAQLEGAELGNAEQSSRVQAVVDWFGPIDFLQMDAQFAGSSCPKTHNAKDSPESRLMGAPIQTIPAIVSTANPMTYITPDDPPFLIEHGTADCTIPPPQSRNFADALKKVIGAEKVTHVPLEGEGHGGPKFEMADNLALVVRFFDRYLK
jgi:acetyl esterase/lipase